MYPKFLVTIVMTVLLLGGTQAALSHPFIAKRQEAAGTAVSAIPEGSGGPFYCILGQTWAPFWSQQCCDIWCCNFNDVVFDDLYWAKSNSAQLPVPVSYWIYTGSECTGERVQVPWEDYRQ